MIIHVITAAATASQVEEMLQSHQSFIKLAVDIRRRIVAGGGEMHADCEAALLHLGSDQDDVWGADWYPVERTVTFESFINIRPRLGNRSLRIEDAGRRSKIESIVRERFRDELGP